MSIDVEALKGRSGIYAIVNSVNGKCYIGQAANIQNRRRQHSFHFKHGTHRNKHLQSSVIKYGPAAFYFSVLEFCSINDLTDRENFWMAHFKCSGLYNKAPAAGTQLGFRHSIEARLRMSQFQKNRPHGPRSPEHNAKMKAILTGKKHSPERIEKNRLAQTGKRLSDATRAKMSLAMKGKPHTAIAQKLAVIANTGAKRSAATKERMRAACANRKPISDETRKRMSAAQLRNSERVRRFMLGRKMSPETRAKISLASTGRTKSPEARAKMSVAKLAYWAARRSA